MGMLNIQYQSNTGFNPKKEKKIGFHCVAIKFNIKS